MFESFWNKTFNGRNSGASLDFAGRRFALWPSGSFCPKVQREIFEEQKTTYSACGMSLSVAQPEPSPLQILRASLIHDVMAFGRKHSSQSGTCDHIFEVLQNAESVFGDPEALPHIVAKAWVLSPGMDQVLLRKAAHGQWDMFNGHIRKIDDCTMDVATRELRSLAPFFRLAPIGGQLFFVSIEDEHPKHTHLCLHYAFRAIDDLLPLMDGAGETVNWFSLGQVGHLDEHGTLLSLSSKTLTELQNA